MKIEIERFSVVRSSHVDSTFYFHFPLFCVLYRITLESFILDSGFPRNSGSNCSLCFIFQLLLLAIDFKLIKIIRLKLFLILSHQETHENHLPLSNIRFYILSYFCLSSISEFDLIMLSQFSAVLFIYLFNLITQTESK